MKIICIGRNYADHAKEMKSEVPEAPIFFMKPDSSVLPKRNPFYLPDFTNELHYEVELIIKISRLGKNIGEKFAHEYYNEIGLGIDFTARDLQQKCKENGHPWEIAKSFDNSCVIGNEFIDKKDLPKNISFELQKNQEVVQQGNSKDMLFSPEQIIAYLSQFMTLKIGDLIFTGTPAGVGKVAINDVLEGYLEGEKMFRVKVK